jgi:hypothetical protein
MTFNIESVEHGIASVAADVVKGAKKVAAAIAKVQGSEAAVEALTSVIDPSAVAIERAAFAALGVVLKTVNDAGSAAAAGSVNVPLDSAFVTDLKGLLPAIQQAAAAQGVKL